MTQAYLALPENYSPERKFPLFVFLYGGHGGPGAGPGRGHQIMENKDCIFVNLPLFKKKFDPAGPFKGLLITTEQDGETICQAYTAMLKKIYATIPNIDTAHNIIGGMSNGAHSIVAMFEKGDAYLMGLFQNLILVEGGFYSIKTYARYQGKGILYLYGDYAGQNDWLGKKMREDLPEDREEARRRHHRQPTQRHRPRHERHRPRHAGEVQCRCQSLVGQATRAIGHDPNASPDSHETHPHPPHRPAACLARLSVRGALTPKRRTPRRSKALIPMRTRARQARQRTPCHRVSSPIPMPRRRFLCNDTGRQPKTRNQHEHPQ